MYQLIDGKAVAKTIREELRKESDSLKMNGIIPRLAVILVGDDAASKIYVKNKKVKQQVKGAGFKGKILIR